MMSKILQQSRDGMNWNVSWWLKLHQRRRHGRISRKFIIIGASSPCGTLFLCHSVILLIPNHHIIATQKSVCLGAIHLFTAKIIVSDCQEKSPKHGSGSLVWSIVLGETKEMDFLILFFALSYFWLSLQYDTTMRVEDHHLGRQKIMDILTP